MDPRIPCSQLYPESTPVYVKIQSSTDKFMMKISQIPTAQFAVMSSLAVSVVAIPLVAVILLLAS